MPTRKRNWSLTIRRQCIERIPTWCWVNMRSQMRSTQEVKHIERKRRDAGKKKNDGTLSYQSNDGMTQRQCSKGEEHMKTHYY